MSIDTLSSCCWYNCCTLPTVSEILITCYGDSVNTSSTSSSAFHIVQTGMLLSLRLIAVMDLGK